MSHQDGLRNHGTEATGLSKPDNDDSRVKKKSENVAHLQDRIKLKNLKNSGRLWNSPTTGLHSTEVPRKNPINGNFEVLVSELAADLSRRRM